MRSLDLFTHNIFIYSTSHYIFFLVQLLSLVQVFVTSWTAACQASLSFTISWGLLKLMFRELVMPFNHLILCQSLLLCPQSFPASGSFPVSRLFASGGQSIGASPSALVLPMSSQTRDQTHINCIGSAES